jgi:hypothetical protein
LDSWLVRILAAVFSWPYLVLALRNTISAWGFLPFSRTEYVGITLCQSLRWDKILMVFLLWFLGMIVAVPLILIGIGVLLILGLNLGACFILGAMRLHRTTIMLDYGFPTKYRLLYGKSDAPVEQQMEGVLQLCDAIAKAEFSPWDQFTAHNVAQGDGLFTGLVKKVTRLGRN